MFMSLLQPPTGDLSPQGLSLHSVAAGANHEKLGKAYIVHDKNLFEGFRSASSREHSMIKMSPSLVGLQLYEVRFLIDGRPLTMI
jgi:hypothetical protein